MIFEDLKIKYICQIRILKITLVPFFLRLYNKLLKNKKKSKNM